MRFDVLTIFPNLLESPLKEGIIRRALRDGKISIELHNIRDHAVDKHSMTDDRPYGGGEGMVMKPEPLAAAVRKVNSVSPGGRVILLSPQGRTFTQRVAEELSTLSHIVLVCGRYEGVDERFRMQYVDDEISIGDYILTGGELPAMVIIDAVTRLLPDVLGCEDSARYDTFSCGVLKHPQYTRPPVFEDMEVPEVLLSGDHAAISEWRFVEAVRKTMKRRPELLKNMQLDAREQKILKKHGLGHILADMAVKS